jgi:hypothetical protein
VRPGGRDWGFGIRDSRALHSRSRAGRSCHLFEAFGACGVRSQDAASRRRTASIAAWCVFRCCAVRVGFAAMRFAALTAFCGLAVFVAGAVAVAGAVKPRPRIASNVAASRRVRRGRFPRSRLRPSYDSSASAICQEDRPPPTSHRGFEPLLPSRCARCARCFSLSLCSLRVLHVLRVSIFRFAPCLMQAVAVANGVATDSHL